MFNKILVNTAIFLSCGLISVLLLQNLHFLLITYKSTGSLLYFTDIFAVYFIYAGIRKIVEKRSIVSHACIIYLITPQINNLNTPYNADLTHTLVNFGIIFVIVFLAIRQQTTNITNNNIEKQSNTQLLSTILFLGFFIIVELSENAQYSTLYYILLWIFIYVLQFYAKKSFHYKQLYYKQQIINLIYAISAFYILYQYKYNSVYMYGSHEYGKIVCIILLIAYHYIKTQSRNLVQN